MSTQVQVNKKLIFHHHDVKIKLFKGKIYFTHCVLSRKSQSMSVVLKAANSHVTCRG